MSPNDGGVGLAPWVRAEASSEAHGHTREGLVGRMFVAYAAYTETALFLLDEKGICRAVTPTSPRVSRTIRRNAELCVGAQYVATLDLAVEGGLIPLPKVGAAMLFAHVAKDGRISLLRSPRLTRFEDRRNDLRLDDDGQDRDSERAPAPSTPIPRGRVSSVQPSPKARPRPFSGGVPYNDEHTGETSVEIDLDFLNETTLPDAVIGGSGGPEASGAHPRLTSNAAAAFRKKGGASRR